MSAYRKRIVPLAAGTVLAVFLTLLLAWAGQGSANAAPKPPRAPVATLTSVTVDPEDANGATTNAPGAWSTNLADPLTQVGVRSGNTFLNETTGAITLGEVSIPLTPGSHTFKLFGTGRAVPLGLFPGTTDYGLVLFFDGAVVPQIAVYNTNPSTDPLTFKVQKPPLPTIIGSANGGEFFVTAPGTDLYSAPNGSTVQVTGFAINAATSNKDLVGATTIGPDGIPDMTATVTLKVTAPK